jgi:hypothetical protein
MRDDFTQIIKETLSKRVGGVCSNPGCSKPTHGPRIEETNSVSIGVAAHITAASSGGPRYDDSLIPEERSSISNGVWLCQNCAKLIDNDQNRYTVEVLRAWKRKAEEKAHERISGILAQSSQQVNRVTDLVSSMSNQPTPARAYLEFRRFENLYFPREEISPLFDIAQVEIDDAGIKIGWEVVEIDKIKFSNFNKILETFSQKTEDIQKQRELGHHYLSVVACGGTTSENEALAKTIEEFCNSTNSNYGVRILIGYMAGIRYVDHVFTGA